MEIKMKFIGTLKRKEYDPAEARQLFEEVELSIHREEDPVKRSLGIYELRNPSVPASERTANRAILVEDLVFGYTARIVQDRVGTDFMTNLPIYKEREVILE